MKPSNELSMLQHIELEQSKAKTKRKWILIYLNKRFENLRDIELSYGNLTILSLKSLKHKKEMQMEAQKSRMDYKVRTCKMNELKKLILEIEDIKELLSEADNIKKYLSEKLEHKMYMKKHLESMNGHLSNK